MGSVKKTETGSVLNFNTYLPKQLTETKISFTPSQEGEGTPSPSNVRPIVGRSSITLYQQGDDGVTHETSVSFDDVPQDIDSSEVAGTIYGGYVDISKSELVAEYYKVPSSALVQYRQNNGYIVYYYNAPNHKSGDSWFCNLIGEYGSFSTSSMNKNIIQKSRIGGKTYLALDETVDISTLEIVYPLANPIHYPLSPRILTTLRGNNVMWSDGDELTISYTDDVVNTYDFRRHISLDTPHKASASGAVASFGTDMVGKMKCKIHFSPQQEGSGTPSPENVREIVGKNGITVWQSGKNLSPELTDTDYWSINGWFDRSGTITLNNAYRMCDYRPVKPDTDYTLSCSRTSWKAIGFYDADYEPIGYKSANAIEVSSKSPSNARYYRIYITSNSTINNIQFEIGTTATEYEPYTGNEITFSFPSTVGDNGVVYGGYLDAENGEVVQEYYTFTLDGTNNKLDSGGTILNSNECEAYAYFGQGTLSGIPRGRGTSYTQLYSNLLPTVRQTSGGGEIVQADNVVNYIRVQLYAETIGVTSGATTTEVIDAINTWLTAHPMQVCYPLRDPVHYPLSPRTLTTLQGSNRIWSDGDSVEVEYYKHTNEPQEYIPAEVLGTGNIAIVTSDGYLIGEEQDFIKY